MAVSSVSESYLIVGAGVFGASTALHLSRNKPEASITLMDRAPFPDPIAASYDINKVVRADYEDIFYCSLGLRALDYWRDDPLWKPYFHQAGMVTIVDEPDIARQIKENFDKLGVKNQAELLTPDDVRGRFQGMYDDADYTNIEEIFWNPESGWADAAKALEATIKAAIDNGVRYVVESVTSLVRNGTVCQGVKTESGKEYTADTVILSTGAYTARLLADSFPDEPELQAGNRISAAGVCEAAIHLTEEQRVRFKDVPVFVLDANTTKGETMPPNSKGELKFIRDMKFANTVVHPKTGEKMMVPMTGKKTSQWTQPDSVPSGLREEIATVIKGIYGKHAADLQPATYRFCWYVSKSCNVIECNDAKFLGTPLRLTTTSLSRPIQEFPIYTSQQWELGMDGNSCPFSVSM